jgi:hypothetical protein
MVMPSDPATFIILLVMDAAIIGGVVYGIYRFATRGKRRKVANEKSKKREKSQQIIYQHSIFKDRIKAQWSARIPRAQGKGSVFLQKVVERAQEAGLPQDTTWSLENMFFDNNTNDTQVFLMFVSGVKEIATQKIFVGAKDWGEMLDVSWYLLEDVYETNQFRIPELNERQKKEVENFVEIISGVVAEEVKRMTDGLDLNISESKGFLNIT